MACAVVFFVYCLFYKGKGQSMTFLCRYSGEAEVQLQPIRNPALEGGGWSAPSSCRFTRGKDPLRIVQEAGWASRRSGRHGRSRFHWDPIPGPSSPYQSLYRPRVPARQDCYKITLFIYGVLCDLVLIKLSRKFAPWRTYSEKTWSQITILARYINWKNMAISFVIV
jgi:hypothetical protein